MGDGPRDSRTHGAPSFVPRADYFIQPHRLAQCDEIFMQKLSPYVNIIPIVAKADTMTRSERDTYRQHIRAKLADLNLEQPPYEFDSGHLAKCKHDPPPPIISHVP